jgi:hypothetical protein
MTIDEALALAESDQYSSDPVVGTLAAEVERLRAENAAQQVNLRKFSELVTSITGELDWFKRRESEFGPADFHTFPATLGRYQDWLKHNPKPGTTP